MFTAKLWDQSCPIYRVLVVCVVWSISFAGISCRMFGWLRLKCSRVAVGKQSILQFRPADLNDWAWLSALTEPWGRLPFVCYPVFVCLCMIRKLPAQYLIIRAYRTTAAWCPFDMVWLWHTFKLDIYSRMSVKIQGLSVAFESHPFKPKFLCPAHL